jgi:hypothetical protein
MWDELVTGYVSKITSFTAVRVECMMIPPTLSRWLQRPMLAGLLLATGFLVAPAAVTPAQAQYYPYYPYPYARYCNPYYYPYGCGPAVYPYYYGRPWRAGWGWGGGWGWHGGGWHGGGWHGGGWHGHR